MKLALTMEKFTLWNKDKNELMNSIKELLDKKHFVKLRMTTSTELANDLYAVDCMAQMWKVQMGIDYEKESNGEARVVVHLNPNYTYSGNSKSESDE